jgi:hypothetical protein
VERGRTKPRGYVIGEADGRARGSISCVGPKVPQRREWRRNVGTVVVCFRARHDGPVVRDLGRGDLRLRHAARPNSRLAYDSDALATASCACLPEFMVDTGQSSCSGHDALLLSRTRGQVGKVSSQLLSSARER